MSLSAKAVSGVKYGPIDHGHVIQMLMNISKHIDAGEVDQARKACDSYIADLSGNEAKGFDEESKNDHFGEEQTEGLADLLAGLKDTPHDDRW